MLLSIIRYFNTWKRYGVAVDELSHLSDRELADIASPGATSLASPGSSRVTSLKPITRPYRHSAPGFGWALPFWGPSGRGLHPFALMIARALGPARNLTRARAPLPFLGRGTHPCRVNREILDLRGQRSDQLDAGNGQDFADLVDADLSLTIGDMVCDRAAMDQHRLGIDLIGNA